MLKSSVVSMNVGVGLSIGIFISLGQFWDLQLLVLIMVADIEAVVQYLWLFCLSLLFTSPVIFYLSL